MRISEWTRPVTPPPVTHLLAEGRSLLAEATLGEWSATPPSGIVLTDYWAVGTTADGLLERFATAGTSLNDKADAHAIAWAMTNLPHLLDALDRVQALLRQWDGESDLRNDLFAAIARECARELRKAVEGNPT
ncbi:hypothetical protein [Nocardia thailandica]|uniref:hypothetical protein n=1 Tax=Nocardia thailandica TaxID=257275 RepID=UPI00030158B0|nr:hypothetical protein [Nocardia thailandica]